MPTDDRQGGMADPLVLINAFEAPRDEAGQFIAAWEKTRDYLKSRPGYVDTALHQAVTPDAVQERELLPNPAPFPQIGSRRINAGPAPRLDVFMAARSALICRLFDVAQYKQEPSWQYSAW